MEKQKKQLLVAAPGGKSYLVPFILITSLFLLWGFAHGLLDVLNKHFQGWTHSIQEVRVPLISSSRALPGKHHRS